MNDQVAVSLLIETTKTIIQLHHHHPPRHSSFVAIAHLLMMSKPLKIPTQTWRNRALYAARLLIKESSSSSKVR